jgi:hypothetical protein
MLLNFIEDSAGNGRFSVLVNTFLGQQHGCNNFGISYFILGAFML